MNNTTLAAIFGVLGDTGWELCVAPPPTTKWGYIFKKRQVDSGQ